MRPDRPLIGGVACLASGIGLIVGYCQGATSMNAAYPFTGSILHIDLTTTGPGVLGGVSLIALGILLLAWAVLAALVSQIMLLVGRDDRYESILHRERSSLVFDDEDYPGSLSVTEDKPTG